MSNCIHTNWIDVSVISDKYGTLKCSSCGRTKKVIKRPVSIIICDDPLQKFTEKERDEQRKIANKWYDRILKARKENDSKTPS